MLSGKKKVEVVSQIHELLMTSEKDLVEMVEKASTSGALTDSMKEEGNYLLAKMLVTLYFRKEPYAPLSPNYNEDLENLSHFF
jgi:hypothetical protein